MRRPAPSLALSVAVLALAALAAGCREQRVPKESPGARRYDVRGEVVRPPGGDGEDLFLRHEAIPDFADAAGNVIGMSSMVMPFELGPGVSARGLAPGDKVKVRFVMDWERNRSWVEAIEKLPADTALRFGPSGGG